MNEENIARTISESELAAILQDTKWTPREGGPIVSPSLWHLAKHTDGKVVVNYQPRANYFRDQAELVRYLRDKRVAIVESGKEYTVSVLRQEQDQITTALALVGEASEASIPAYA